MHNLRGNGICVLALGVIGCSIVFGSTTSVPAVNYLDQQWKNPEREKFYTLSQGSHLIPYYWFEALKQSSSTEPFAADGLARFGYLPNASNADNLPVGFVRDPDDKGKWLGMTCAACHTSRMTYGNKTLQIDGGPADADLSRFLTELGQALEETLADNTKFADFASEVIKRDSKAGPATKLRAEVNEFLHGSSRVPSFTRFVQDSKPELEWGPARADAFGMIFNRVASIDLYRFGSIDTETAKSNSKPPNAPVSYPFLWGTSQQKKVQWNGSAPNELLVHRLARNVGEVLGVFATIELKRPTLLRPFYRSSVNRSNLIALEESVSRLRPPVWPETLLPRIDVERAKQGKLLYARLCSGCHQTAAKLQDVGTDPTMAEVCSKRTVATGNLAGVKRGIWYGDPLGKEDLAINLVQNAVVGAILSPITGVPEGAKLNSIPLDGRSALDQALDVGALRRSALNVKQRTSAESQLGDQLERAVESLDTGPPKAEYEARSLNGIWATAPFLHNGSVSSLYELLLPSRERAKQFSVGSQEFDPRFVGFKSGSGDGSFVFDTSRPGNLNTGHEGHEYGTDLSDPERGQIVEYLKTLGSDLNALGKGPIPPTDPPSRPGSAETRENIQIEEISADQTSLQVRSGGQTLTLAVKTPEIKSVLEHFGKGDQLESLVFEEASGQHILKGLAVKDQREVATPRLLALLLSAVLLWVLWLILLRGEVLDLIKGADNRYSNSKFQVVLWFFVLIVTYLATVGLRVWSSHTAAFAGGVNIPQNLLLLSGLSALTFAAAKGITQSKIDTGEVTKTTAGTARFPFDLFHDDEGRVDMADFQAVIVTLLAVVVYLIRVYGFLGLIELHKSVELPDLDTTILAAFGLGQGAYLAKKYVADVGGGQPATQTAPPDPAPPAAPMENEGGRP